MPLLLIRRHAYFAWLVVRWLEPGSCLPLGAGGCTQASRALDDGTALVQRSLSGGSSAQQSRFQELHKTAAADGNERRESPPPLADNKYDEYFGGRRVIHRHKETPGGNGSSAPRLMLERRSRSVVSVDELVRFGGISSMDRSREECKDFPKTCMPPFTCEKHEAGLRKRHRPVRLATEEGRANVHSWCGYPRGYVRYAQQCAAGNLFHAAQELRKVQEERRRPDGSYPLLIMDAAYCFASGHCNDTAVTLHTTIPQAEAMCDAKYSRRAWTGVSPVAMAASPKRRGTDSSWGKVACAMGTFHCDIVYCRVYYCKDMEWRARFGHLAQDEAKAGSKR